MDKQTTFGFVLIGVVLILWMWLQTPTVPPPHSGSADSLRHTQEAPKAPVKVEPPPVLPDTLVRSTQDLLGSYFSSRATGDEKHMVIQTDEYTEEITSKGGLLRKWELTRYKTWDG